MNKIFLLIVFAFVIAAGVGYFFSRSNLVEAPTNGGSFTVNSFKDCVKKGSPVMESYPPRCSFGGKTFTQNIGNELEMADLITLTTPRPNDLIKSPLRIEGQARGSWFFEAEGGRVMVLDENGLELGGGSIQAQGEWMTDEFVLFEGKSIFDPKGANYGTLIIPNANPSDLPENSKELKIPVKFE